MSSQADAPQLIASGTIAPYRGVAIDTTADTNTSDNTGLYPTGRTIPVVGISDSQTKAQDSASNAVAGDPITLQNGAVVTIECGGTVTHGEMLEFDSSGRVITATTTSGLNYQAYQALESGTIGAKIRCMRIAGFARYA